MIQTVKQCGKLATSLLFKVTGGQTGRDRVSIWWMQLREIRKVRRIAKQAVLQLTDLFRRLGIQERPKPKHRLPRRHQRRTIQQAEINQGLPLGRLRDGYTVRADRDMLCHSVSTWIKWRVVILFG